MAERKDAVVKPRLLWADVFGVDLGRVIRESAIWERGRQVGFAQGELSGRLALAQEIEEMFPEHKEGIASDDAIRIRCKQIH